MRALPAILLVPLLAACGTSPGSAAPSATPTAQSELAIYRELAACLRAHGYPNLPDPVQDPRTGEIDLPPGTVKPPDSALAPCRSIMAKLPKRGRPSHRPPTAAEMAGLKKFAACMRSHGLRDFPDPNPEGDFQLPRSYASKGKQGMRTQLDACKKEHPGTLERGGPGGMYLEESS
ncbi:hypothetical protein [Nonomuraea sp. NPDC049784]|uniref:hypothetical protein n=1 Tax=Nonomuraea sp. NPDC049784 TaxID=3154361 RepID=UPI0033D129EE